MKPGPSSATEKSRVCVARCEVDADVDGSAPHARHRALDRFERAEIDRIFDWRGGSADAPLIDLYVDR